MRSTSLKLSALLAMVAIGGLAPEAGASLRHAGSAHRPTPPRRNTALEREIADHNAEVDRRKAEKRALRQPKPNKD